MAISVKTSSSVSEGTQLVKQLSIKQPLILRRFSHSEYRVDQKKKKKNAGLSVVRRCFVVLPVDIWVQDP